MCTINGLTVFFISVDCFCVLSDVVRVSIVINERRYETASFGCCWWRTWYALLDAMSPSCFVVTPIHMEITTENAKSIVQWPCSAADKVG